MVFYNRLAEVVGQYLKKGSAAYVEGRIKTRKWQDKATGQDRYATEIVADSMQMLGGRNDGGFSDAPYSTPPQAPATPAPTASQAMIMDDDIPF